MIFIEFPNCTNNSHNYSLNTNVEVLGQAVRGTGLHQGPVDKGGWVQCQIDRQVCQPKVRAGGI